MFSYEHTEAVLLGEILRRATGKPHDQLIDETILQPLGIASAAHGPPARRAHDAGRHRFDERVEPIRRARPSRDAALLARGIQPSERRRSEIYCDRRSRDRRRADAAGGQIVSAATRRNLQRTVVRLPATVGGPLRELLPVAFGLGAAELRDGFHGNTGVSAGQCLGVRFDERCRMCVAVGLNAMVPYLRDFVLAAVCRELSRTGRPPTSPRTVSSSSSPISKAPTSDPAAAPSRCATTTGGWSARSAESAMRDRLCVELALDDDGRAVLRSPLPHLSLGFFREPAATSGSCSGSRAYKRGSTKRPFHR